MHNPKLTAVRRQSAVQRLLGRDAEPEALEQENPEGDKAATEAAKAPPLKRSCYLILRGRFEMLPSLKLYNRQGRLRSFDYASITGVNMDGPHKLVLHYEGRDCYTITLEGLDLDKELEDGIDDKLAVWIQEVDELTAAKIRKDDPEEGVVTGIRIEKGITSREWEATGNTETRKSGKKTTVDPPGGEGS